MCMSWNKTANILQFITAYKYHNILSSIYLILQKGVVTLVKPKFRNLQGIHDELKKPVEWCHDS